MMMWFHYVIQKLFFLGGGMKINLFSQAFKNLECKFFLPGCCYPKKILKITQFLKVFRIFSSVVREHGMES